MKKIDELIGEYTTLLDFLSYVYWRGWISKENYERRRKELSGLIKMLLTRKSKGEKHV